jgi:hypothetical protein
MKVINRLNRHLASAGLALAVLGLLATPAFSQAQEKGATKLLWSKPVKTVADVQALEPGDMVSMSCPKCQNVQTVVVEKSFKATVPDAKKTVTTHLCPGCSTKIRPVGGKREAKVIHACNGCGSEKVTCCAIKPGTTPSPDMEKK